MDDMSTVYEWAKTYSFDPLELQSATLVTLEIIDGSSGMDYDNDNLFISAYEGICDNTQLDFTGKVQQLITLSRGDDPIVPKKEYVEAIHAITLAMRKNQDSSSVDHYKQLVWEHQN